MMKNPDIRKREICANPKCNRSFSTRSKNRVLCHHCDPPRRRRREPIQVDQHKGFTLPHQAPQLFHHEPPVTVEVTDNE